MTKDNALTLLADSTQAAERKAFSLEEMITCGECLRANPPTRNTCFYCAAPLPLSSGVAEDQQAAKIAGETGQRGYSVVVLPHENIALTGDALSEAAAFLRFKIEELAALLSMRQPLPLAYAATIEAANQSKEGLSALGLGALIVTDEDLDCIPSPTRIRTLELLEESLVGLSTGDRRTISVGWGELVLIVAGRLNVNRVEIEQPKRRRNRKPAERRELSHDDAVLDIYTKARNGGWRITAQHFDFSCLEENKSVLAVENICLLTNSLREAAKNAHFDDSYTRVRRTLDAVWPVQLQTESSGWRRARAGKYSMTTATIHDNEAQFTRYSRLSHYLRLGQLEKIP